MSVGKTFEGRDVAEALEAASRELGRPADSLPYQVVEEGRRGIMGMGFRPTRIWVELPPDEALRVEAAVQPARVADSPDQRAIEETLYRMFHLMGLDLQVRSSTTLEGCRFDLSGPDRGMLLHRDGELLGAFEFLLNRMARRSWPGAGRLEVDSGSRRRSGRDDEVVELAREVASQVRRTGHPKSLHPMNGYERRLVHLTVREFPDLVSRSDGEGSLKTITVERVPT